MAGPPGRRILLHALFAPDHATVMAEEASRLLQGWDAAAASGRAMDLHRQMTGYTMRVLGRLLFGDDLDAAVPEVTAAFPVINHHTTAASWHRCGRRAAGPPRMPGRPPCSAVNRASPDC